MRYLSALLITALVASVLGVALSAAPASAVPGRHQQVLATANQCGPDINPAGRPSSRSGGGLWVLDSAGDIHARGTSAQGDISAASGRRPAGLAAASGRGYWIVDDAGTVHPRGDAPALGDTSTVNLNASVGALEAHPRLAGYWLLGADGGVFTFGDADFYGSTGNIALNAPVISMSATASGTGYWLLGADGGVFTFGDAEFYGSTGNIALNAPVRSMAVHPSGEGYWLLGADGGVFTFGAARFWGSLPGTGQCDLGAAAAIEATETGDGYWIITEDGRLHAFGDAVRFNDVSLPRGRTIVDLEVRPSSGHAAPTPTRPLPTPNSPPAPSPAPPGGGGSNLGKGAVTGTWSAANLAVKAANRLNRAQAVALARDVDTLVVTNRLLGEHLGAMRRANPDLEVLVYLNAAFAQSSQGSRYPADWYARDRRGNKIRSRGYGNWLMDPTHPGWIRERSETCGSWARQQGYDGCYLDMLGSAPLFPGYATGIPVQRRTGSVFTHRSWHAATARLAQTISSRNRGLTVIGNGAANGNRYFRDELGSDVVVAQLDAGVAELWLRAAPEGINAWPTEAQWRQDVDMLAHAEARGIGIYTLTKIGVRHTRAQADQWHRFSAASFLLGAQGRSRYSFVANEAVDAVRPDTYAFPDLGTPRGRYAAVGALYVRDFARGRVVVNPSGRPHRLDLDGTYRLGNRQVSGSVTVPAHDGVILERG